MKTPRLVLLSSIAGLGVCLPPGSVTAALVDTFDGAGSPATATQLGEGTAPAVIADGTNNVLRLVDGINSQNNHYSYSLTDPGAFETISASFDFRITPGSSGLADGFGFMLIPTALHGQSGDGPNPTAEEPNSAGAFGVGIDVYPGINNVSTHWNGFQVNELQLPTVAPGVNFRGNQLFNRAQIDLQRVGNGTNVRVSLTENSLGTPGTPYRVMEITMPNMLPFENRVQFAARTGGENLKLDLDNVNVTYSNPFTAALPAAPTGHLYQDFDSTGTTGYRAVQLSQRTDAVFRPGPLIKAEDAGSDGAFMRIVNDATEGQAGHIAFDRAFDGGTSTQIEVLQFDLRLNSTNQPADGMGVLFLPTTHPNYNNGAYTPVGDGIGSSEQPNHPGVLALGFDVYPNGGPDIAPGVSLHWDNMQVADVALPSGLGLNQFHRMQVLREAVAGGLNVSVIGIPDVNGVAGAPVTIMDRVFVAGASNYDYRVQFSGRTGGADADHDIDNVSAFQNAKALQPQTGTTFALGEGSGYKTFLHREGAPAALLNEGGPNGTFLRLIHDGAGSQTNSIAFDKQTDGTVAGATGINVNFDARAFSIDTPADGFSLLLIPTATYGDLGAGPLPGEAEEPNLPGVFGLGVDLYNGGTPFNELSLHWDGLTVANMDVDPALVDLDSGVFHHYRLELRPSGADMLADLIVTPDSFGAPGTPVTVFNDVVLPGMGLYDYRVELVARSGGLNMAVDLDNVQAQTVPEPSSALLLGLGGLLWSGARRRTRSV
jgi:hypothetical protein